MYLKSIEVQGFKSFANKIKFEFHNGITGIVGPNGSGKSNIGDAVRWVLGEQSARQLRGSKMEDVIFSGTQSRRPMGFAYVAITFENANRIIPLDYEEVTVARRVYRSGESEYLINGSSCRRRDIVELFYDTGIGKEGYSIIGQGQVEKILSGKIEDSRELFDEAAGIAKYKKKHGDIHKLYEKVTFQMNDTHPTVAVAELMRILMDEEGLGWDEAWEVTTKSVAYTNHTIMSEALEKWPIELFSRLLPRVYQIIEEINRRFILEIQAKYPGNYEKIKKMAIIYDGQVKMAHLAIAAGYSVNGVARLHTEILKNQELKDFYEMMPEKFNNKTNGITQRRFLLHANPLLADWITEHIGPDWITDLPQLKKLAVYADDEKALQEFMNIKFKNKERLAKYILEHNGVEVDPHSIFDVQVKRLHEYKRQLLNILHVIYLYNQIKMHPEMEFYPRTFIFGAKASAGYATAKKIIKLINSVADVVNNDASINGKIKVVFIENYRVSNAEWIFAAADVSEQISTASKEASGTGNMKFMLNGAPTLGTMDGANVEIVEEVGAENAFIFGLSSDEVINYENNGGYDPNVIYNTDEEIRQVLMQLINGTFSNDTELFRDLYDSLLNTKNTDRADRYFILADFRSYADAQKRVEAAYRDEKGWAKKALLNTACSGKFTSDRTIQEYVDDIWHLDKVIVRKK